MVINKTLKLALSWSHSHYDCPDLNHSGNGQEKMLQQILVLTVLEVACIDVSVYGRFG